MRSNCKLQIILVPTLRRGNAIPRRSGVDRIANPFPILHFLPGRGSVPQLRPSPERGNEISTRFEYYLVHFAICNLQFAIENPASYSWLCPPSAPSPPAGFGGSAAAGDWGCGVSARCGS